MAQSQKLVTIRLRETDDKAIEHHLERELSDGWVISSITALGTAVRMPFGRGGDHEHGSLAMCWVAVILTR